MLGRANSLLVALIACGIALLAASPAFAAEKLRVGKAVAEAFSFVPPDVGMQRGDFPEEQCRR